MIPKFRAWIKVDKQMKEVTTMEFTEGNLEYVCFDCEEWDYSPESVVLMQSTGLRDKNGQEIFEGDVVRLNVYNQLKCGIYEVRRGEAGDWQMQNRTRTKIISLIYSPGSTEVIGNIYTNPELMEEENDHV